MQAPDLSEDWEGKLLQDRETERRQLLMYAATVVEPTKQGSKHQLLSAISIWEKIQDAIICMSEGLTP